MIVMKKLDVNVSKNDTDAFFQCVTKILLLVCDWLDVLTQQNINDNELFTGL